SPVRKNQRNSTASPTNKMNTAKVLLGRRAAPRDPLPLGPAGSTGGRLGFSIELPSLFRVWRIGERSLQVISSTRIETEARILFDAGRAGRGRYSAALDEPQGMS